MALQKDKVLPNGASGNYWRINGLIVDPVTKQIMYVMALFKDKAHSDSGKPNLGVGKKYSFSLSDNQLNGNLRELGYNLIKAKAASLVDQLGLDGKPTGQQVPFDADLIETEDV